MLRRSSLKYLLALVFLLPMHSFADDSLDKYFIELQQTLPTPGTIISYPGARAYSTYGKGIRKKIIESDGVPGGEAFSVKAIKKNKEAYKSGMKTPILSAVAEGDLLLVAVWVRIIKVADGGQGEISGVSVQLSGKPYTTFFTTNISATEEWAPYYFWGRASEDFGKEALAVSYPLLTKKQTMQFGPTFVMNLGKTTTEEELAKRFNK